MYTVLRFINIEDRKGGEKLLEALGLKLNKIIPGIYRGMDGIGGRFSIPITKTKDWTGHQKEIVKFLNKHSRLFSQINNKKIIMEIDIALEPEDLVNIPSGFKVLYFDKDLLINLVKQKILMTATIYKPV